MSGKSVSFRDKKKSEKVIFTKIKKIFKVYAIDVNKILVSNEERYGKKIHLNI